MTNNNNLFEIIEKAARDKVKELDLSGKKSCFSRSTRK